MGFWTKEVCETQTFADLIRGLQHSVNAALEMLESRNIELLGRYFTEKGIPLSKRLSIDDQTSVDIPLISIVNPVAINIKEVEMEFDVQINSAELKKKTPQAGFSTGNKEEHFTNGLERSSLEVSFGGKKNSSTMNVKIKFESHPIPEGLSRIIDEYNKTILPFDNNNQ